VKACEAIAAEANPGGLVAHLIVEGDVVDVAPLSVVPDHAGAHAIRHAGTALRAQGRGVPPQAIEVRIFDGDSGQLVARIATP
jgi:hypothetical protein